MKTYAHEYTRAGGQIGLVDDPYTSGLWALWDTARQQYVRHSMSLQEATAWAADAPYVSEEGQQIFWGRQVRPHQTPGPDPGLVADLRQQDRQG